MVEKQEPLDILFEEIYRTKYDTTTKSNGEIIVAPKQRKELKEKLQKAIGAIVGDRLENLGHLVELVEDYDGWYLRMENAEEGVIVVKINVVVKNLNYDEDEG